MDLRQLEMLLAVVEAGGYKKAGERLFVSHSAIHRQIRLLEHELQDRLLVRRGRRVQLTDAGSLLVDLARRVKREISNVQNRLNEAHQLQSGHLRIGTGTTALTFFLPSVLTRYRSQYPRVDITITTGTADLIVREIQIGELDLGIVFGPSDMLPGDLVPNYELLYQEEFVLAVGADHPLASRRSVSLRDAVAYPFITYPKPSHVRRLIDQVLAEIGATPQIVMELENEEAIEQMIGINIGITFLSRRRAVRDHIRYFRPREGRVLCDVGLVLPPLDYQPHAAREFARFCFEAKEAMQAAPVAGRVANARVPAPQSPRSARRSRKPS